MAQITTVNEGDASESDADVPVSQHLKEGVMVNILSNIIQVIVLSTGTNALLRVDSARNVEKFHLWITRSKELGLELIHARIGKQEGGIVMGDARTGSPIDVLMVFNEKVDEGRSDLVHGPFELFYFLVFSF
jgi:hypothetical protein